MQQIGDVLAELAATPVGTITALLVDDADDIQRLVADLQRAESAARERSDESRFDRAGIANFWFPIEGGGDVGSVRRVLDTATCAAVDRGARGLFVVHGAVAEAVDHLPAWRVVPIRQQDAFNRSSSLGHLPWAFERVWRS